MRGEIEVSSYFEWAIFPSLPGGTDLAFKAGERERAFVSNGGKKRRGGMPRRRPQEAKGDFGETPRRRKKGKRKSGGPKERSSSRNAKFVCAVTSRNSRGAKTLRRGAAGALRPRKRGFSLLSLSVFYSSFTLSPDLFNSHL